MVYQTELTEPAAAELRAVRKYDQRQIVEEMEKQLKDQPLVETRNRKPIGEPVAGFEYVPPLWELRVGHFRVFYDVDEADKKVTVRAIRRKDRGQTTEEILQ